MRREDIALHGALLITVIFWGVAFTAIKLALGHMSWVTLTFLRFGLASLLFAVSLILSPPAVRIQRHDLPIIALIGFCGFTGYHLFLNFGEADPSTTAGTSALVIASAPAFMAILAVWRLGEKVTRVRAGGIALAFTGLAVMLLLSEEGSAFHFSLSTGASLILPAALFAAFYAILSKPYLQRYSPFQLTAFAVFFGTLFTVPVAIVNAPRTWSDLVSMGVQGILPVLFLALFPTFIAYSIWFRGLKRMDASALGAYVYLSTLVAVIAGILLLGESVTPPAIVGGVMVIGGVYLAQRRAR